MLAYPIIAAFLLAEDSLFRSKSLTWISRSMAQIIRVTRLHLHAASLLRRAASGASRLAEKESLLATLRAFSSPVGELPNDVASLFSVSLPSGRHLQNTGNEACAAVFCDCHISIAKNGQSANSAQRAEIQNC